MKKTFTILMALMALCFTQCKPTPEGGDENSRKVKVSCTIPISEGDRSDFTNLMETGKVNWSEGQECVYVAIHGEQPTIIELEGFAYGNPSKLTFEGEVAKDLLTSGAEYDIWYFGHSQQLDAPYFNLAKDGTTLTGSIANQSGRLEDLGYCHIAKTTVTAVTENGEVRLNLNGTLKNQIAIAVLNLEGVEELYGSAINGTEYTLAYDADTDRYELVVTEDANANISVGSGSDDSYIVLLPNEKKETKLKCVKGGKKYATTFFGDIKANKIYYRTASDGATVESLPWSEIQEIDGHEYVDLGLPSGLLWATCNVGAETPEEYGDYFAWGETSTKAEYTEANSLTNGKEMGDISGNVQYDAATANWGGDWRMPTKSEYNELLNNCTCTWTAQNGVKGYKVTSNVNGNYIFLPAAGIRLMSSLGDAGNNGYYWSSTPVASNSSFAFYLSFNNGYHGMYNNRRYSGRSVRPVCGGNNAEPEDPETPETPNANVHEYVDLGLSVKWATCNVGATSPEEYGNYYAWGETAPAPNNNYISSNCSTCGLTMSQLQSQGYIDDNGNLTAQYDAARANWGGDWRMPTYEELNELIAQCTWTWTTQNGVNGYNVEGPNGNSIFLPAAGYRYGSSLYDAGSYGFYWSSAPYGGGSIDAYGLRFGSSSRYMSSGFSRYYGRSVRPVLE